MKNFWSSFVKTTEDKIKIKKPIYALAPMAGVADSAFRQICKSYGADVLYSEMASVTGLVFDSQKTLDLIQFDMKERPYIVQLFGSEPKHFVKATKIISETVKPDGIDINFGCPVKKVIKQGAGVVLMNDLKQSRKIIKAVIDNIDLPVSIKTRVSIKDVDVLRFLDNVRDLDIKTIMIHGRTFEQGFSGAINTEIIRKAKDYFGGIIIANGGINSCDDAEKILDQTQADGIGIARGALGRPWIFKAVRTGQSVERAQKPVFKEAIKHAKLVNELKGDQGILEMRKHLCWYVHGFPGAKELRKQLVHVETLKDIEKILQIKNG